MSTNENPLEKIPLTSEVHCNLQEVTLKIPKNILDSLKIICDFIEISIEEILIDFIISEAQSIFDEPEYIFRHCKIHETKQFKKLIDGLEWWRRFLTDKYNLGE